MGVQTVTAGGCQAARIPLSSVAPKDDRRHLREDPSGNGFPGRSWLLTKSSTYSFSLKALVSLVESVRYAAALSSFCLAATNRSTAAKAFSRFSTDPMGLDIRSRPRLREDVLRLPLPLGRRYRDDRRLVSIAEACAGVSAVRRIVHKAGPDWMKLSASILKWSSGLKAGILLSSAAAQDDRRHLREDASGNGFPGRSSFYKPPHQRLRLSKGSAARSLTTLVRHIEPPESSGWAPTPGSVGARDTRGC